MNTNETNQSKPDTLHTFTMKGLRTLNHTHPLRPDIPADHIRRSPHFPEITHELYGWKEANYTPYTNVWFLSHERPELHDFLHRQEQFYETLRLRELHTLQAYTLYGDRFLNNFLRQSDRDIAELLADMLARKDDPETPLDYQIYDNFATLQAQGLDLPAYADLMLPSGRLNRAACRDIVRRNQAWFSVFENLKPLIFQLFAEMMDILLRAPRPRAPFVVYRGVSTEHQTSLTFTSTDFWSTSISPDAALDFAKGGTGFDNEYCCVYEITVSADVPCMFLNPISKVSGELEILLLPSTVYTSSSRMSRKALYPPATHSIQPYVYTTQLTAVRFDPDTLTYASLEARWAAQRARALKRTHRRLKYGPALNNTARNPKTLRRSKTTKHAAANVSYMPARYTVRRATKRRPWNRREKRLPPNNEAAWSAVIEGENEN